MYLSFLNKLTIKKVINIISIYFSYLISTFNNKSRLIGFPLSISIEPSPLCNLSCPECGFNRQSNLKDAFIQVDLFKNLILQLYPILTNLFLYFRGEPFLHKSIFEMISFANQHFIFTCLSTNGHFLNLDNSEKLVKSKLDKLIISIDGTTQESYEKYRIGGNLDKVKEGIANLVETKNAFKSKYPYIVLQLIVMKQNQHQIKDFKVLGKMLKVDQTLLKSIRIENFETETDLLPDIDKFSRYKKGKNDKFYIKSDLKNNCWRLWNSAVISWDGKVLPCCFDKKENFVMGDLNSENFFEIWKGKIYTDFRNKLLKNRKNIEMCRNCAEGLKI